MRIQLASDGQAVVLFQNPTETLAFLQQVRLPKDKDQRELCMMIARLEIIIAQQRTALN